MPMHDVRAVAVQVREEPAARVWLMGEGFSGVQLRLPL